MIVVSDTSPISGLYRTNRLHLLRQLFQRIIIPRKVFEELSELVRWGYDLAELKDATWIEIRELADREHFERLKRQLGDGEAEAIALTKELRADILLIDEAKGRMIAKAEGLRIAGILSLLIDAKELGIIATVKEPLDELIVTTKFRVSKSLYREVLSRVGEQ